MKATAPKVVRHVPVSQPVLGEREYAAVNAVMRSGMISGFSGTSINEFETLFARFCGTRFGVSTTNGTTAIHLALIALDIGPGDEVLVSTLTNMATFFAVLYQGAVPVPIDAEPDTCNMDPGLLEAKVTPRTKAILVVHLFGHPVDMDPVMRVAKKHSLKVIEDAAEAHGAEYKGTRVGGIGDIGCFSFYANKIITTGEGGMITLNDPELAARSRSLKSLAFGDVDKFMHREIGYNYRMTNLQAAIGVAQMARVEEIIEGKRRVAAYYTERLAGIDELQLPVEKPYARNVYWMYHVVLRGKLAGRRRSILGALLDRGIETRDSFVPYNLQEVFIAQGRTRSDECPVANEIGRNGFYIPSTPTLDEDDLDHVAKGMVEVLDAELG